MSAQKKIVVLFEHIDTSMKYFDKRRNQNKKRAFWYKMAVITVSALITVLLGLKSINNSLLSDFILFLAASVTVINGFDSFYDHRGLWEKDVKTLSSLRELKYSIEYYIAGKAEGELSIDVLNNYQKRLQEILSIDINKWSGVREGANKIEKDTEK
ncbi:DUF4231 domain-containing protein [Bacillus thuringiensis]|uniref:DUF4231 domain-containing protein n=1 Tax=Bacillus thuringiensis TaxID=1428 RepID=UPI0035D729B5